VGKPGDWVSSRSTFKVQRSETARNIEHGFRQFRVDAMSEEQTFRLGQWFKTFNRFAPFNCATQLRSKHF
jgi:hypothetical protein